MTTNVFIITKIEGEYAYLQNSDGEEVFIAMALIPPGADIGSELIYADGGFEIPR